MSKYRVETRLIRDETRRGAPRDPYAGWYARLISEMHKERVESLSANNLHSHTDINKI